MNYKKYIPHLAAIVIFLVLSIVYVYPVLEGKKVKQGDIIQFKGMSKEIVDHREDHGEEPLWTNGMFGGMPAYQVSMISKANLMNTIDDILSLGLPRPADYIFLNFLGFFILLLVMRVNPWVSLMGAVAYSFSSYFFIIIEAGHTSKAHAMTYMGPVVAGVILAYRGKYLWGAALTALFLGIEIACNHLQITYYLALIVLALIIGEFIHHLKENKLPQFIKASLFLLAAALLAIATNSTLLLTTMEYADHSIRGKSELTIGENENRTSGLDRDYATTWSYGKEETLTLLIPNTKGGATGPIGMQNKGMEDVRSEFRQSVAQSNHYWGDQPGTSGPVYVGAIIMFFFVLGLFLLEGRIKWPLLAVTILAIFLSWGKNMMWFTDLFLDYFPGYNKFRTVSMILVIAEFTIPLLAILTVAKIINTPSIIKEKKNQFFASFGLTAGVALILWIMPDVFLSFLSQQEIAMFGEQMKQSPANYAAQIDMFMGALADVRIQIFKADAIRTFLFIALAAAVLYLFSKNIIKKPVFILSLTLLILVDMWAIDKRYLSDEDFVRKREMSNPFPMTAADKQIKADPDPNFRVMNLAVNTFNDASTSYYHKSIGGYHGAKMKRYQELITHQIANNNIRVLDMLNTKYFIMPNNDRSGVVAQFNYTALGHAWFVKNVNEVQNADEEIKALDTFIPAKDVIVDKRFADQYKNHMSVDSVSGDIALTSYKSNELVYKTNTTQDQVAVFSEIYYPEGWEVTIDGEEVDHFRANYVLRAMVVPAGQHEIVFKFNPSSYRVGEAITLIASILIILLVIGVAYMEIMKARKENLSTES
jgi:hypothetical protein